MYLKHLSIVNYRNIGQAELDLSPKINCFIGNNGVGKTNMLDAVYHLALSKSHMTGIESLNIRHGEGLFLIQGDFRTRGVDSPLLISSGYSSLGGKTLKRNKKEYERVADHIGTIPLVIISPRDQGLISDGSEERRKFVNGVIAQYDRVYLENVMAYKAALTQRNALLKEESFDRGVMEAIEWKMDVSAQYIYQKRLEFVGTFSPVFQQFYSSVSSGRESVGLEYSSHLSKGVSLLSLMAGCRETDIARGYTTVGPHRDDLQLKMDDFLLRNVASQGQAKTYLIALKLAQFDFLAKMSGSLPILIMDDIFDKLDSLRVEQIVRMINDDSRFEQIFISDTDREHISLILDRTGVDYFLFEMVDGSASLVAKREV